MKKTPVRQIVNKVHRIVYGRLKTRNEILRLSAEDSAVSRPLVNTFNVVLEESLSPEEELWIDRIESQRDELNHPLAYPLILEQSRQAVTFYITANTSGENSNHQRSVPSCEQTIRMHFYKFRTCQGISAAHQAADQAAT